MNLNLPVSLRHSRRLQGDILCDASGRLYERVGQSVYLVHHLVAGPHGEVIDLAPPPPRSFQRAISVIDAEAQAAGHDLETPPPQPVTPWREIAMAAAKPRVVRFGEFKNVLGPQLLHPERLRDTHRLSCRVQVYEVIRAQRLETLMSDIFDGGNGALLPLSDALAARLALAELVQRRRPATPPNRESGLMFPGERVVRLGVIEDPTATLPTQEPETPQPTEAPSRATPRASTPAAAPIVSPGVPVARVVPAAVAAAAPVAAPAAAAVVVPAVRAALTAIPERFVGTCPFALSRDQAVYDLNMDRARSWGRTLVDRLRGAATSGRELRKWQGALRGKSLDDQLWAVPPPRGDVGSRKVDAWARRTLEAAGYESAAMLLEWEIFWRRKGL
jgi:hypothetical protein